MQTRIVRIAAVSAVLATSAFAQTPSLSIFFTTRYDTPSLDASAGPILGTLRPFDICAVTPGPGATAFPVISGAGLSAMIGDPNSDGVVAEFSKLPDKKFGFSGVFVKHADRKSADPSKLYYGIREVSTNDPKIELHTATGTHTVVVGDYFRIKADGTAELFITQKHIMDAAGPQTGVFCPGAGALCQDQNLNLYYSPPRNICSHNAYGGGHRVGGAWVNDGGIILIPASAITYDNDGNVSAITTGSAEIVAYEVNTGTNYVRAMCQNSGAKDRTGAPTNITYQVVGLDIDPNGGTFVPYYSNTATVPNLIFTVNTATGGSWFGWRSPIFTTADNGITRGDLATINGQLMGTKTGNADGSWNGVATLAGEDDAPIIRGLAWMETDWNSTAPYGYSSLKVPNDGLVELSVDPNVRLASQGAAAFLPTTVAVGLGVATGGKSLSFDTSFIWDGFSRLYLGTPLVFLGTGVVDGAGRSGLVIPVPTNIPSLVGANVFWQAVSISGGTKDFLSNPVVTEIR